MTPTYTNIADRIQNQGSGIQQFYNADMWQNNNPAGWLYADVVRVHRNERVSRDCYYGIDN